LMDKVNREIISFLFKGELPAREANPIREARSVRRKQKVETSKEEVLNSDEMAMRNRQVGAGASRAPQTVETVVRDSRKIGRNERVEILHVVSGERKTVKFKQAEPLLAKGEWVLAESS
jgi:preprotein translocase subunit SecA